MMTKKEIHKKALLDAAAFLEGDASGANFFSEDDPDYTDENDEAIRDEILRIARELKARAFGKRVSCTVRLNSQGRLEVLCAEKHRMHIAGFFDHEEVHFNCQECEGDVSTKYRSITLQEAFGVDVVGEEKRRHLLPR